MNNKSQYSFEKANRFGWGLKRVALNKERLYFIEKNIIGNKLLDVGCGIGAYVDYFTNKEFKVVGIDFKKEFIAVAKKKHRGKFICSNAKNLPFRDNSFHTVLIIDVLEHLENEIEVLLELKRVSSRRIIIIVPNNTDNRLEKSGLIYRHHLDPSHRRTYNNKYLRLLFKKAKIKIIKYELLNLINIEIVLRALFYSNKTISKIIIKIFTLFLKRRKFFSDIGIVGEI